MTDHVRVELAYYVPYYLLGGQSRERRSWSSTTSKKVTRPFKEVEVVPQDIPSNYDENRINVNDSFISFANLPDQSRVELQSQGPIFSTNGAQKIVINDDLEITFHRTLRMPDDKRLHQLPASLGHFALFNVEEYADRLPSNITKQGGLLFPMWQREAMWMGFSVKTHSIYALRIFVGRINAVSGLLMGEELPYINDMEMKQDYIVVPQQRWVDGICVAPGVVRQFVAMPLGSGYTIEGQKTGKEDIGGLQIEVTPAYKSDLKIWFRASEKEPGVTNLLQSLHEQTTPAANNIKPGDKLRVHPVPPIHEVPYKISDLAADLPAPETHMTAWDLNWEQRRAAFEWSTTSMIETADTLLASQTYNMPHPPSSTFACLVGPSGSGTRKRRGRMMVKSETPINPSKSESRIVDIKTTNLAVMGLAAGGKLIQDIVKDLTPQNCWNTSQSRLINIHIFDPTSCEEITHIVPQPPPMDAKAYTDADLPFYVVQEDVDNRLEEGDFGNVKSVSAMDKAFGVTTEEEFDPMKPRMCTQCEKRLCDCIIRPWNHQFCNTCILALTDASPASSSSAPPPSKAPEGRICPRCARPVDRVAGFSAPMNLPGEEGFKANVPVHVLSAEQDGRNAFRSIYHTRL